ncbi:hypothetical protein EVAR_26598_1 [Eumeta japonica]|uniref:Uncharacterized protein n=1 Tax=Eumeta variegata TaxID=151549 RepID=A0A4C1W6I0_EUMVA|nr:hypothetical protein EVAR_26598_1 [Eumeta japonica]
MLSVECVLKAGVDIEGSQPKGDSSIPEVSVPVLYKTKDIWAGSGIKNPGPQKEIENGTRENNYRIIRIKSGDQGRYQDQYRNQKARTIGVAARSVPEPELKAGTILGVAARSFHLKDEETRFMSTRAKPELKASNGIYSSTVSRAMMSSAITPSLKSVPFFVEEFHCAETSATALFSSTISRAMISSARTPSLKSVPFFVEEFHRARKPAPLHCFLVHDQSNDD